MSKTIQLTRQELVWQTRRNSWNEEDYAKYLAWLKGFKTQVETTDNPNSMWARNNAAVYDAISAYSWDEIVEMIKNDNYDDENRIQIRGSDGEVLYTQHIIDIIKDAIREDNYDSDIYEEDYADDYDERFDVMEGSEQ